MYKVAEYVGRGHPDRLCDTIVERIIDKVIAKDTNSFCALECAIFHDKVFLDGRIAAGQKQPVISETQIDDIVKSVFVDAGYSRLRKEKNRKPFYHPFEEEIQIYKELLIEPLSDKERRQRHLSDDQNVVTGYANQNSKTFHLPMEHYLANLIGKELDKLFRNNINYGSDYKVLVYLDCIDKYYNLERVTISIHHMRMDYKTIYQDLKYLVEKRLKSSNICDLVNFNRMDFYVNGSSDFLCGGSYGDNGLSGKKLVVDFYGPDIPIGGGAISGKDPYKVDVCGAFKARQMAIELIKKTNFQEVFTRLSWSPGKELPRSIEAYGIDMFGVKFDIDVSKYLERKQFSIKNIVNDLDLVNKSKETMLLNGYMFSI